MFDRLINTQEKRIEERVNKCVEMWENNEPVTCEQLNKWLKETGLSKSEFENLVMKKYTPEIKEAEIYTWCKEKYSRPVSTMREGESVIVTMESGRKAEYVCSKRKLAWNVDWHWIYLKFNKYVD